MQFPLNYLLHGVGLIIFIDQKDVAVGAFADDAFYGDVLEADFFLDGGGWLHWEWVIRNSYEMMKICFGASDLYIINKL
jgi:hypothetical protein